MAEQTQTVDDLVVSVIAAPGTAGEPELAVSGEAVPGNTLTTGENAVDLQLLVDGDVSLGGESFAINTGSGSDSISVYGSSSNAASAPATSLSVDAGDGDDKIDTRGTDNGMTLDGGAGNDLIRGGAGDDIIYGDGEDGNDFHTIEAVFGGSRNHPGGVDHPELTVTGFRAGETMEDATAANIGGHSGGIGVKSAQAERPSITEETGYDPIMQESEGVVFSLERDAAFADIDLTYFFSKQSGADVWHNEVGKWSIYDNGKLIGTGTFTADSASGNFTVHIPEQNGGNRYFDQVVIEGLPYEVVNADDRPFDATYNHGVDVDSSDFLIKSATFETVGHDKLWGGEGDDTIMAGYGHDWVGGGAGADYMDGGKGRDWLTYRDEPAKETTFTAEDEGLDEAAQHEYDNVRASLAEEYKDLNAGGAELDTYLNFEHLEGTNRDDFLMGNHQGNSLRGLNGDDTLVGLAGRDSLAGGNGDDVLYGDDITGEIAGDNDWLHGQNGNDIMYGGGGNDWLVGGQGNDHYDGGDGNDWARIYGNQDVSVDLS